MDTIWFSASGFSYYAMRDKLTFLKNKSLANFEVLRYDNNPSCDQEFQELQAFTLPDKSEVIVCQRINSL